MSQLHRNRPPVAPARTGFRLNKQDGKLMGVCAGLADRFGLDPLAWRLIFIVGTIAGFGLLIPAYITIGLLAD